MVYSTTGLWLSPNVWSPQKRWRHWTFPTTTSTGTVLTSSPRVSRQTTLFKYSRWRITFVNKLIIYFMLFLRTLKTGFQFSDWEQSSDHNRGDGPRDGGIQWQQPCPPAGYDRELMASYNCDVIYRNYWHRCTKRPTCLYIFIHSCIIFFSWFFLVACVGFFPTGFPSYTSSHTLYLCKGWCAYNVFP